MGFEDSIREAVKQVTNDVNGWGVAIELTAPNAQVANIIGMHTKHHLGIDTDGLAVNSKKANIAFAESTLIAANAAYPIRIAGGEVSFKNHKVKVKDSTGTLCQYMIREWFPDEEVGLIICILGDFK